MMKGMSSWVTATVSGPSALSPLESSTTPAPDTSSSTASGVSMASTVNTDVQPITEPNAPSVLPPKRLWEAVERVFPSAPSRLGHRTAPALDGLTTQPVTAPHIALQGLDEDARDQLLACTRAALRDHVDRLPSDLQAASPEDWRLVAMAVCASASAQAASQWLGYVPDQLALQLRVVLQSVISGRNFSATVSQANQREDSARDSEEGEGTTAISSTANALPSAASSAELAHSEGTFAVLAAYARAALDALNLSGSPASPAPSPSRPLAPMTDATRALINEEMWEAIEEKASLHAVLLRYLRFGNDADMDESSRLLQSQAAAGPSLEGAPLATDRVPYAQAALLQARVRAREHLLQHAPSLLVDLSISVADSVADSYLSEVRAGAEGGRLNRKLNQRDVLPGSGWAPMLHPRLASTRALERFRNQVAINRLTERQFRSVIAMFEDRYDIWSCERGTGRLVRKQLPVRRALEMEQLKGFRSTLSLALEALDVFLPMLRNLGERLSNLLSFLFVNLIGRSLGLIFRGIRQGLGMNNASNSNATSQGNNNNNNNAAKNTTASWPSGLAAGGNAAAGPMLAAGSASDWSPAI